MVLAMFVVAIITLVLIAVTLTLFILEMNSVGDFADVGIPMVIVTVLFAFILAVCSIINFVIS